MVSYCHLCQTELDEGIVLENMPYSAQPTTIRNPLGSTLDIRQCKYCGLIQLTNPPVLGYRDVIRAGGISPSMRERQARAFKAFLEYFSLDGKRILEIGAGNGEYLSILKSCGVQAAFGLENSAKGTDLIQGYPSDKRTLDVLGGHFDAFICINFLEHIPEINSFLRDSASLLVEGGKGMISVPKFNMDIFDIMREHVFYFTEDSLHNALSMNGYDVIELFVNSDLNVLTSYVKKRELVEFSTMDFFATQINGFLETSGKTAIWGASHHAFSIIALTKIGPKISYIVDSSPSKQGKFAPGSGLSIYSPDQLNKEPVDSIIVIAPEYAKEIIETIKRDYPMVTKVVYFIEGELWQ